MLLVRRIGMLSARAVSCRVGPSATFRTLAAARRPAARVSLTAAAAATFSGASLLALSQHHHNNRPALAEGAANGANSSQYLTANFIADAAAQASPALVNIRVEGGFFRASSGSGFIIDSSGLILTNTHVVKDAMQAGPGGSVKVTLSDGVTELRGVVQHADAAADIAIVKVRPSKALPTVKLGSSEGLRPGEFVVALGAPAGLTNSVSAGIVSAVHRTRSELGMRDMREWRERGGGGRSRSSHMEYIQTDAAINSGNSGGPLLNIRGEVIGVNTMKAMDMDGIAFALPIDEVKRVVDHLHRHGRVLRPYLGLKFVELNQSTAREFRERGGGGGGGGGGPPSAGLYVMHVTPDSPAQRAGLRVGDTITGLDERPVRTTKELIDGLTRKVGARVAVEVQRGDDGSRVALGCHVESLQQ